MKINNICKSCVKDCKQWAICIIFHCPMYKQKPIKNQKKKIIKFVNLVE